MALGASGIRFSVSITDLGAVLPNAFERPAEDTWPGYKYCSIRDLRLRDYWRVEQARPPWQLHRSRLSEAMPLPRRPARHRINVYPA